MAHLRGWDLYGYDDYCRQVEEETIKDLRQEVRDLKRQISGL